jgi:hypothetical protein
MTNLSVEADLMHMDRCDNFYGISTNSKKLQKIQIEGFDNSLEEAYEELFKNEAVKDDEK